MGWNDLLTSYTGYEAPARDWLTMANAKADAAAQSAQRTEVLVLAMSDRLDARHAELVAAVRDAGDDNAPIDYERLGKAIAVNLPDPRSGITSDELENQLTELFSRIYRLNDDQDQEAPIS